MAPGHGYADVGDCDPCAPGKASHQPVSAACGLSKNGLAGHAGQQHPAHRKKTAPQGLPWNNANPERPKEKSIIAQRRRNEEDDPLAPPSLAEDRQMLDALLGFDLQAAAVEAQQLIDRAPVAVRDQLEAAVRDAHTAFLSGPRTASARWVANEAATTYRTRAKVIAAVLRCIDRHRCPHVGQILPTYAFPAARVITCAGCLPGFRPVFVVSDQRHRDHTDMTCDLCLQEATYFRPFITQLADIVIHGDACGHCQEGG